MAVEWVGVLLVCGGLIGALLVAAPWWAGALGGKPAHVICQVVGAQCPEPADDDADATRPEWTFQAKRAAGDGPLADLGFGDDAACADVDGRDSQVCRGRGDGHLREDVDDTAAEDSDLVPIKTVEGVECAQDPNAPRELCDYRTKDDTGIIAGCLPPKGQDGTDQDCTDTNQDADATVTGDRIDRCVDRRVKASATQPTTRFTTYEITATCVSDSGEVHGGCHTRATTSNNADGSGNPPGHVTDQDLVCANRSLHDGQVTDCTPAGTANQVDCTLSNDPRRTRVRCAFLHDAPHHCATPRPPRLDPAGVEVSCVTVATAVGRVTQACASLADGKVWRCGGPADTTPRNPSTACDGRRFAPQDAACPTSLSVTTASCTFGRGASTLGATCTLDAGAPTDCVVAASPTPAVEPTGRCPLNGINPGRRLLAGERTLFALLRNREVAGRITSPAVLAQVAGFCSGVFFHALDRVAGMLHLADGDRTLLYGNGPPRAFDYARREFVALAETDIPRGFRRLVERADGAWSAIAAVLGPQMAEAMRGIGPPIVEMGQAPAIAPAEYVYDARTSLGLVTVRAPAMDTHVMSQLAEALVLRLLGPSLATLRTDAARQAGRVLARAAAYDLVQRIDAGYGVALGRSMAGDRTFQAMLAASRTAAHFAADRAQAIVFAVVRRYLASGGIRGVRAGIRDALVAELGQAAAAAAATFFNQQIEAIEA